MSNLHYWHDRHREQVLALLAALGIDPKGVTAITLRIRVGTVSTVEIERQVENGQIQAVAEVMRGYQEEKVEPL